MSCTYHMCPHMEWFFKFEEVDGGVVYIGGGVVYIGSGDVSYITEMSLIQLRNHGGSIRILTDVRYVLKLKKNLISLTTLEYEGLVVIIQDGVLNVISGALLVMNDTRRNNLYYYNGRIVIEVVATVSGSDEDLEISSLWHKRLG